MAKKPKAWDEAFERETYTPEEIEESDKRVDEMQRKIEAAQAVFDRMERCLWCKPDSEGRYSTAMFEHPNGTQRLLMFFNGGQITLRMEVDGQEAAHMHYPINYCPMCGQRVRMEAVPGETD